MNVRVRTSTGNAPFGREDFFAADVETLTEVAVAFSETSEGRFAAEPDNWSGVSGGCVKRAACAAAIAGRALICTRPGRIPRTTRNTHRTEFGHDELRRKAATFRTAQPEDQRHHATPSRGKLQPEAEG